MSLVLASRGNFSAAISRLREGGFLKVQAPTTDSLSWQVESR